MASNFHYTIDLNKDQNHQPFLYHLEPSHHHHDDDHHHQVPSSSSSSPISQSSSYLPFLINSHQDQLHLGYNNTYHVLLDHQPLQSKMFVSSDGTSSCDQMVPKETRLKLKIRKRDGNQDQTHLVQYPTKLDTTTNSIKWLSSKMRLMKKKRKTTITNQEDHQVVINESVCNGNNINGLIRVCSDCNTTKTPLWRSGPRGPKSLCNACGIRQRKARRAAMAAAAAATTLGVPLQPLHKKKKKKSKVSSSLMAQKTEICKQMISLEEEEVAASSSSSNKNKLCFDDLTIMLSKNSTYDQQMFPPDEKEAAILLMSLSYGMVHG